jgi:hypothetical protein
MKPQPSFPLSHKRSWPSLVPSQAAANQQWDKKKQKQAQVQKYKNTEI